MARRKRKNGSKNRIANDKRRKSTGSQSRAKPKRTKSQPKPRLSRRRGTRPSKSPRRARVKPRSSPAAAKRPVKPVLVPQNRNLEAAILEMNRGQSLTAASRESGIPREQLKSLLIGRRLARRKGDRWTIKDNRPRRVPVMTKGRSRNFTVAGFKEAQLVGEHHNAVGDFVRTNDIALLRPFEGRSVRLTTGKEIPLETDPNALHRIAAMDTPPFHEIYEIPTAA